jgi:hypothetical protein
MSFLVLFDSCNNAASQQILNRDDIAFAIEIVGSRTGRFLSDAPGLNSPSKSR